MTDIQDHGAQKHHRSGWPWEQLPETRWTSMPSGNDWPKISIVTPSYNQGQFLEETILSVLNQGYPNLEYFVMDGGSTDNSVEIIQKFASQLTYWESKPDKGQSHAINKGFKMATGELVAWLNSDDVLLPGTLCEIAKVWLEDRSVGFIHGISELIDENSNSLEKTHGSTFDFLDSLMTSKNPVAQPSTFISRQCLSEVGYLDETLHMSMDWDLWLRIGNKYPTRFISKVFSGSRHWPMTKTRTQVEKSAEDHISIVKRIARDKRIGLQSEVTKQALAAGYGLLALYQYQSSMQVRSKLSLARSLLYYPKLQGGDANCILRRTFPFFFFFKSKLSAVMERLGLS